MSGWLQSRDEWGPYRAGVSEASTEQGWVVGYRAGMSGAST